MIAQQTPARLGALVLACALARSACGSEYPLESASRFISDSGVTVDAYEGRFKVPAVRGDADSGFLTLRYVRFPSTSPQPGAPIVYLAGGPGGSGISAARGRRFKLFQKLRATADVIALDQRGTGSSDAPPVCESSLRVPTGEVANDTEFTAVYRRAVEECREFWEAQDVDLRSFTTRESVEDLGDLRLFLGAEKLTLWGISYGTHLALAALKYLPGAIDRVILASVEGLNQTVKLPSRTDAYFERLSAHLGDEALVPRMRRVHAQLDRVPVPIAMASESGEAALLTLQRRHLQMLSSRAIADPATARRLGVLYRAADDGNYEAVARTVMQVLRPADSLTLRAMPLAMDRASGIAQARLARVQAEAETSILGAYLNFPMPQLNAVLPELDLGDEFREPPGSDVPALVLMGTLDGRTYPQSQEEAVSGLSRATLVRIHGAGHNLFLSSPRVLEVMLEFLNSDDLPARRLDIEAGS